MLSIFLFFIAVFFSNFFRFRSAKLWSYNDHLFWRFFLPALLHLFFHQRSYYPFGIHFFLYFYPLIKNFPNVLFLNFRRSRPLFPNYFSLLLFWIEQVFSVFWPFVLCLYFDLLIIMTLCNVSVLNFMFIQVPSSSSGYFFRDRGFVILHIKG